MTELEAEQSMDLQNTLQAAIPRNATQLVVLDALGAMIGSQCKSEPELRAALRLVTESALAAYNRPEAFVRMYDA